MYFRSLVVHIIFLYVTVILILLYNQYKKDYIISNLI